MERTCTDCKVQLEPIRILDATAPSWGEAGRGHINLHYAAYNADQSWFTGSVKDALPITGLICPQCRRISLFG